MSSTFLRIISSVKSLSDVNNPSAIVLGLTEGINVLFLKDLYASSAPLGSAAIILIFGFIDFPEIAVPLNKPPPPTGTIIISKSDSFSSNSLAAVPCPHITLKLSNG